MNSAEASEYRNSLANEILREQNKDRRRVVLANARLTHQYKAAADLRQEQCSLRGATFDQVDPLLLYAQRHCEQYKAVDTEKIELLHQIALNRDRFKSEVLPNVAEDLIYTVLDLMDGKRETEVVTALKRANFDYENLLASSADEQVKVSALLEALLKARSYDDVVEINRNKDIDFTGFEDDSDIPDAKQFIYRVFGRDLLQQCLISKVRYVANKVKVRIEGNDYLLPVQVYQEWERIMPGVKSKKFRGESFVLWNTDPGFSKRFVITPIDFYSFYGEDPDKLKYLEDVASKDKMRQYKLGTISHEVAHHIYDYLMDADKRARWKNLVDESEAVTEYAKTYLDDPLKYDESFTESVRLKTTASDYLKTHFPEMDKFLSENFPSIKC